jgi:hypothetical protein
MTCLDDGLLKALVAVSRTVLVETTLDDGTTLSVNGSSVVLCTCMVDVVVVLASAAAEATGPRATSRAHITAPVARTPGEPTHLSNFFFLMA